LGKSISFYASTGTPLKTQDSFVLSRNWNELAEQATPVLLCFVLSYQLLYCFAY
jgi:hypothetical protein